MHNDAYREYTNMLICALLVRLFSPNILGGDYAVTAGKTFLVLLEIMYYHANIKKKKPVQCYE